MCFITVRLFLISFTLSRSKWSSYATDLKRLYLKVLEDTELLFSFRLGRKTGPRSWMYRQTGQHISSQPFWDYSIDSWDFFAKENAHFFFELFVRCSKNRRIFYLWFVKFKDEWFCHFDMCTFFCMITTLGWLSSWCFLFTWKKREENRKYRLDVTEYVLGVCVI